MVKIKMEVYDKWVLIETIPLTQKTLSDFEKRIPDPLMWRPVLLNKVVKQPKLNVGDWYSKVPTSFIDDILFCIYDIVGRYLNDKDRLEKLLENSFEDYSLEDLKEISKERDLLIERLDSVEEDFGVFEYNKEDLKKLRKKKPKPLYIG